MKKFHMAATAVVALLSFGAATAAHAETREKIDKDVAATLVKFHAINGANESLSKKAAGILVFPHVTKAGAGVAGEHGEGVLQVDGKTVGY